VSKNLLLAQALAICRHSLAMVINCLVQKFTLDVRNGLDVLLKLKLFSFKNTKSIKVVNFVGFRLVYELPCLVDNKFWTIFIKRGDPYQKKTQNYFSTKYGNSYTNRKPTKFTSSFGYYSKNYDFVPLPAPIRFF